VEPVKPSETKKPSSSSEEKVKVKAPEVDKKKRVQAPHLHLLTKNKKSYRQNPLLKDSPLLLKPQLSTCPLMTQLKMEKVSGNI